VSIVLARDLAVARGGVPVLEDVSFELGPGEALILRGPNGIGKTTLLRVLAGLQPPVAGTLGVADGAVALAAHADGLKGALSVAENLSFWAAVHGTREVAPALKALGLTGLADRAAQHLSAGQRRRLGLARLLVTGRSVWALDEPTVSLDVDGVALFAAAMRAHLEGGGAAVIATHVDVGVDGAVLDLGPYRARRRPPDAFDAAFA
jgi:heme exporter protein A